MKSQVEILAPAGSMGCLKAAIKAGADAVYIGGTQFGARAFAKNLDEKDLLWAIDYVHLHGRKIYLTINTLMKDFELEALYNYLEPYYECGLDAVIVQDPGVMKYIKEQFPKLPIHVSTQATVTGGLGARFYENYGVSRVVPAREISLKEIKTIKKTTKLEVECFVHGALCYCYSGQCLFSSMIGGRSGNRGQCAQPCRLPFSIENSGTQDFLSLKDLCTIDQIPELIEAGIDSFKIEGRMKQPEYVYTVVTMYRKYVDLYEKKGKKEFAVSKTDRKILMDCYQRRGYTDGYYKRHNDRNMISRKQPQYQEQNLSVFDENDMKLKEKINGKLILRENETAKLYIEYQNEKVCVEGNTVQKAKNQPLDRQRIEKQIRKTGETEFSFDKMDIEMDATVFLSMKEINELRRAGLNQLMDDILSRYRRKTEMKREELLRNTEKDIQEKGFRQEISVLISSKEQLELALHRDFIDVLYIDQPHKMISALKNDSVFLSTKKKKVLVMPYIFRERSIPYYEKNYAWINECFDGIMIRNFEEYQWLLEHEFSKEIHTDAGVYLWNQWDKKVLSECHVQQWTAPLELNCKELNKLQISSGALCVYGYKPLMLTANCIKNTWSGCENKEGWMQLKDRKHASFPVYHCCHDCYNIIYNSKPLMLHTEAEEIEKLNPRQIRLDFVMESKEEMNHILDLYYKTFCCDLVVENSNYDYTKGHFRRGVK